MGRNFFESEITIWPVVLSHVCGSRKATGFPFNLFPHLVKSAGLCRCKVEMGKGNDGLEGKLRQQRGEEERLPRDCWLAAMQMCPTVVIHLIHLL